MNHYLLGPDGETPELFDVGENLERVGAWALRWEPQRQLAADAFGQFRLETRSETSFRPSVLERGEGWLSQPHMLDDQHERDE